jgi:flagellar motor switch protein FliM
VSLRNLIRLQSGDTFPIQISDGVKVLVEGKDIFKAELGQVGPQAALHLNERLKPKDSE